MRKSEFVHQAVLNMLINRNSDKVADSPAALGNLAKAHAEHLESQGFKFDEERMRFGG